MDSAEWRAIRSNRTPAGMTPMDRSVEKREAFFNTPCCAVGSSDTMMLSRGQADL
jgi:hypothetical protein